MKGWEAVPPALGGNLVRELSTLLKIAPLLNDFHAERSHRSVFFNAIVDRHYDRGRNSVLTCGESDGLAVISSCRRNQAGGLATRAAKLVDVDETTAHLEGAGRSVVFVLYPDGRAHTGVEQWPPILWSRRHRAIDECRGRLQIDQRRQLVQSIMCHFRPRVLESRSYEPWI